MMPGSVYLRISKRLRDDDRRSDESRLARLQTDGVNIQQPQVIHHFVAVPLEKLPTLTEWRSQQYGGPYTVTWQEDQADGVWHVEATERALPTLVGLRASRAEMEKLAEATGGFYEGWEIYYRRGFCEP